MFIMIFSVILDVLFTLVIFMLKMKQKLRLRTTRSLPTTCKQRMILDICYGLWLIMIDTEIFWFQMISTISWLIKCMLSIWRLDLFIKRHVSLTVNIYYSHMRKLILEPCAWICKHPWSDQKKICVFTVTRPTLIFASDPMNFYTEFG